MKKIIAFIVVGGLGFGIFSCEKRSLNDNLPSEFVDPSNANLKVVNAYTSNVPAGAPGVGVTRFFVHQDNVKLSGNALAAPGIFPTSSMYASVTPGRKSLFMLLDRRVNNIYAPPMAGDTAFRVAMDLKAGEFYTAFLVGVAPTQQVILTEDDLTLPAEKTYKMRFANLIPDPVRGLNVYSRREKKMIATNVTYKQIGNFIELPVPTVSDTLDVFETTNLVTPVFTLNNFFPGNKRIYTYYAQGRLGFRTQALSIYTNR